MNTTAAICAGNWFKGSRGRIGFVRAQCFFTTKRDNYSSLQYEWGTRHTNANLKSCFPATRISILRRTVIASLSPNWIQTQYLYVARKGRIPGIHDNWGDCKSQVQGFRGDEYTKFSSRIEAKEYVAGHGISSTRCMTKKAFVKDLERKNAYKIQPEEHLAKAAKSKRSRKSLDETESNEELHNASSPLNKTLENSSKSTRSRKEADAAGSNKVEEPLVKATKLKRTRKKLDETESIEDFVKASSQLEESLAKATKLKRARKKVVETDFNKVEEPLVKATKLKRTRKKLDETESIEDFAKASSQLEEPLAKATKLKRARKKVVETGSNEDLLEASSHPEELLVKTNKSKVTRKKLDETVSNEDLLPPFSQPEESLAKGNKFKRKKKKLDETESNKELVIVPSSLNRPLGNCPKSTRLRKQAGAADSNGDLLQGSFQLEDPLAKTTKLKRTRKKLDETESNKELLVASSPLDKPLRKSSKSTMSRKQADAEDSTMDLFQVSEKPLEKSTKSKKSGKKIDATDSDEAFYQLEFDGASKGNPGKAGAGALLRNQDGKVVYELREGIGHATNNVAEYHAVILGLKVALSKGISQIRVKGDSNLVCKQIQGLWKTKNENMARLCAEAKQLKRKFKKFQIRHIDREFNSDADALANAAVNLQNGEWISRKVGLQDSSDASSSVQLLENTATSRSSKKIGVIVSNKDLFQVSEEPPETIFKSEEVRKKLDPTDSDKVCYQLEFDGASKGNPGKAGAGALLRNQDGKVVYRLREGVGFATNNVAEYRAVILGLKVALSQGITRIYVQGDSKLVCMQIQGLWKTKNTSMAKLCAEAMKLKTKFKEFYVRHIDREFNSDADALANAAIKLRNGECFSNKVDAKGHTA